MLVRSALTTRAERWATAAVGRYGRAVSDVAAEMGCDWHTVKQTGASFGLKHCWPPTQSVSVHRRRWGLDETLLDVRAASGPTGGAPKSLTCVAASLNKGYPEAILLGDEDRRGWCQSYVETIVQRDISELGDIRRVSAMVELLAWPASNTSAELNTQAACRQLGIDRATFGSYFAWLETVFLAQALPAWSRKGRFAFEVGVSGVRVRG